MEYKHNHPSKPRRFRVILVLSIAYLMGIIAICGEAAKCMVDSSPAFHPRPPLCVSDNGRYLVTAEGDPFFGLGDS